MASPLVRWLTARTADELATILAHRRDTLEPPFVADLGGLAARLQLNHSVYAALTTLSLPAFEVVEAMAALGGPAVPRERLAAAIGRTTGDPDLAATLRNLADRAIVWTDDAGDLRMGGALWTAGMAAGVGRLDRGAPFHPTPPEVAVTEAAAAAVTDEATTAAIALVETVAAVVGAAPVALRKTGDVGLPEARRLAAAAGGDEQRVRVCVELARAAGLLAPAGAGSLVPTDAYDAWYADQPAGRFVSLAGRWPTLSTVAGVPPERAGDRVATGGPAGSTAAALRTALVMLLGELPGGRGYANEADLAAALRWRLPTLAPATAYPRLVAGLLAEGRLVGAVALGALTPFGSALREGGAALRKAADELLPAPVDEAVFRADLTVVVTGIPTGELAALLDAAAVRESTGAAATWRFTPASVRAALDAGGTPEGLRNALAAVAAGRALPQVLEVLIEDAGRRHGAVTVRSVRCVLHTAQPALLAEILRTRSLGELGLTRLAP
ncbi:MAG TPA: helicase-associated domain-containing protein, partial [Asanoa sp.]